MTERRAPPPVPRGATPPQEHVWTHLLRLWQYVMEGYEGLPAPHSHVGGEVVASAGSDSGSSKADIFMLMGA